MDYKDTVDASDFLKNEIGIELTFGDLLEVYRMRNNMSQQELANKLGYSKQVILDIENGKEIPSIDKASEIAKTLKQSQKMYVYHSIEDQVKRLGLDIKIDIA